MSQGEVIKLLEKKKKWVTAEELSKSTDASVKNVRASLRRLFNHNEVIKKMEFIGRTRNLVFFWKSKK